MQRWTVGAIEVVRVADDDLLLPAEPPLPAWTVTSGLTPDAGRLPIAFTALAIRSGATRIVVDPWLANDGVRTRPDAAARAARLLAALAAAGFPAEEIDLVVNSHIDGLGWNTRPPTGPDAGAASPAPDPRAWIPSFPRARYRFPAVELADAAAGVHGPAGEGLAPLLAAGVVDPVDEAFTAAGATPEPIEVAAGVSLANAPGHNAGHLAVRIEDGGALAVYAGHLFLTPGEIADPRRPEDVDPDLAERTRRVILDELADRSGTLLTTIVGGRGGGVVERDPAAGAAGGGYRLARWSAT